MKTGPGLTPVTSPLLSMVAITEELQAQLKVTPVTALPLASTAAAVNCWVAFTAIVAVCGEMVMDAMGCATVSVAGALVTTALDAPAAEAVICVLPLLRPRASPLPSMLATFGALLAQANFTPVSVFPLESCAVAENDST